MPIYIHTAAISSHFFPIHTKSVFRKEFFLLYAILFSLKMEENDTAMIIHNGFCNQECQDNRITSILFALDAGITHCVPCTSRQEIFTTPPWLLQDFFHRNFFVGENCRSWIFHHLTPPTEFNLMDSFFSWKIIGHERLQTHCRFFFLRTFILKYKRNHLHQDNIKCDCDHDANSELVKGWTMFEYRYHNNHCFCLSFYDANEARGNCIKDISDAHSFQYGGTGFSVPREIQNEEPNAHNSEKKRSLDILCATSCRKGKEEKQVIEDQDCSSTKHSSLGSASDLEFDKSTEESCFRAKQWVRKKLHFSVGVGNSSLVGVKHISYGSPSSSSSSIQGESERDFFVELWDVSGHERYKDCRSLFYSQINGVIFVHDLSQKRTKTSLQKKVSEVAATGTFTAPLPSGSSGNLVDAARHCVEKQGLLPSSEELPLFESFPGNGGLIAAAKETRCDKEAFNKFFRMLIRRRYFSDELPAALPWSVSSIPTTSSVLLDEITSDGDDQFYKRTSLHGDPYKYSNTLPPLPAQRNLTPPPTLYPQLPVSTPDNCSLPRFSLSSVQETPNNDSARSKRLDINV